MCFVKNGKCVARTIFPLLYFFKISPYILLARILCTELIACFNLAVVKILQQWNHAQGTKPHYHARTRQKACRAPEETDKL